MVYLLAIRAALLKAQLRKAHLFDSRMSLLLFQPWVHKPSYALIHLPVL